MPCVVSHHAGLGSGHHCVTHYLQEPRHSPELLKGLDEGSLWFLPALSVRQSVIQVGLGLGLTLSFTHRALPGSQNIWELS